MRPGLDGFGVVRRLRQNGRYTPVLFLTARDAAEDKVSGLTLGGDDYVTKPFSLDEVLARIRAVLRRSRGPQRAAEAPRLSFADIELDEESHEVIKAGRVVPLSPTRSPSPASLPRPPCAPTCSASRTTSCAPSWPRSSTTRGRSWPPARPRTGGCPPPCTSAASHPAPTGCSSSVPPMRTTPASR